ncbi:MAG: prenyltransferase [Gammaproteobacteria bacterium]|nr:prenyltransferase [Gammaproteobacteria bacterium]MDE2346056.1 prenyltransferase [Gammaproteobacteria bacterium]
MASVLHSLRPNFLTLPPVCVLLGVGIAWHLTGHLNTLDVVLVLLGALLAHASVNLLNEYQDFTSGLDAMTVKTPFSGGSGALQANPQAAALTLTAGVTSLVFTGAIGFYFLLVHGLALLPLGVLGLVIIGIYTNWITRYPLLCLIAPGLSFGPLMVMGTGYVLMNGYSWAAFLASLTPFFLVSELLLINQFPDVEADRKVGRRHFPITIGRRASALIYANFLLLAFVPIAVGVAIGLFPLMTLIGLVPLLAALPLAYQVLRKAEQPTALTPYLGMNVGVIMATITLFALGWFI